MGARHGSSGFSILSVMIGTVLAGFLLVTITSILKNAFQTQQKVTTRLDIENSVAMASRLLNSNLCTESLKNLTFPADPPGILTARIPNISLRTPTTGVPLLQVGQNASSRARISRIDLTNFVPIDASNYTADIEIEFVDPVSTSTMAIVRRVPILMTTSVVPATSPVARKITKCALKPDSNLGPSGNIAIAVHDGACPTGFNTLWTGHSIVSGGDLGDVGSCQENFAIPDTHDFASGFSSSLSGSNTMWLTTYVGPATKAQATASPAPKPPTSSCNATTTLAVMQPNLRSCAACDANGVLIVRHSYTNNLPTCPTGYDELWQGYSLESVGGKVQDATRPGSCAPYFDLWLGVNLSRNATPPNTFACTALTTAWKRSNLLDGAPYTYLTELVSRCVVCFRENPSENDP